MRQPKLTKFAQITRDRKEKRLYQALRTAYFRTSHNLHRRTDEVRALDAIATAARKLVAGSRTPGQPLRMVTTADLNALEEALDKAAR